MTDTVQIGNVGVKLTVTVTDASGDAVNLAGATNIKIKLRPNASKTGGKTFDATAENLAAGQVSYTFEADDIDMIGDWKVQVYYELGGWAGHTRPATAFKVEENLDI